MLARFSLLRGVLSRSYVSIDQVPIWKLDNFHFQVPTLVDCKAHRDFLVVNETQIPPSIVSYSLEYFLRHRLLLDEHWPEICMLVKRQLKTYDRHVAPHVFRVAQYMSLLGEKNQELWDIVETKLVKEGLIRYLTEVQCVILLRNFAEAGLGSDALIAKLTQEVELHARELPPKMLKSAIEAFEISGRGSPKTLQLLTAQLKFAGAPIPA